MNALLSNRNQICQHSGQAAMVLLQAALTSELPLIQGPPGTGKSYVGIELVKILLNNTNPIPEASPGQWRRPEGPGKPVVGPILIVCLTNHALDQFLEALLNAGITSMVRVGSG